MSLQYEESNEDKRQITPEEYLQERKAAIRARSWWAIGFGIFAIAGSFAAIWLAVNYFPEYMEDAAGKSVFYFLFRNLYFLLGIFFLAVGIWGLYYAKKLKFEDLIPSPEAIEFARQSVSTTPYYSYILVGCIIAVTITQNYAGLDESVEIAGLVKPYIWENHQYWRILTGAALHGGFLHIFFNGYALYGFGSLIEYLSNRAHLTVVFLLAIIGGGLTSLYFMPDAASIGASGGIMGLIGYLAVYGYRRRQQLSPDFLKSMLVNIGFIAAFGLVAYQVVDNFAHLGGLIVGAIYGFVQVPRDLHKNPRNVSNFTKIIGVIALGIFILTCLFSILLLLRVIQA
ncbi:hypothetical protein BH24ACI2_BH24ACI2_13360 [soil metagenome]|jgi:membrane associated rhomboid family serine protease|nr:rhomboid family intramembrane serine protease [Acidobacteriota bacterium]